MRLPSVLRAAPSLADVERALLTELSRYDTSEGNQHVPNAWTVWLSGRDERRRGQNLPAWSAALQQRFVEESQRRGLPASGFVTVGFATDGAVAPGTFRLTSTIRPGEATVVRQPSTLPGRPRLVLAAGGSTPQGSPASAGIEREVLLRPGTFVIGRDRDADLRLHDASVSPRHVVLEVAEDGERIRLRDLGSLNGTLVNGVPTVAFDLVDGNRIELGSATLVFHRDPLDDDGGRQGGETP